MKILNYILKMFVLLVDKTEKKEKTEFSFKNFCCQSVLLLFCLLPYILFTKFILKTINK